MKRSLIITLTVLCLFILQGCSGPKSTVKVAEYNGKMKVYTSFYVLYDFTKKIGGDKIELVNLVPAGIEPHDWEPTPRILKDLTKAELFIYNGAGLEPWAEKFIKAIDNDKLLTVEASAGLALREGHEEEPGTESNQDPHVWLNPLLALEEGRKIKDALISLNPSNKDYYEANFLSFATKLENLDKAFLEGLAPFKGKKIVVAHDAFGYLTDRYGLVQLPIMGLSPEAEPSPAGLASIAKEMKAQNIEYIFFEELVSPKVAQVLAQEVGAKTLVLNPIEGLTGEQAKAGKEYFTLMYQNLDNLKLALGTK